jgi:hypothetical protein
MTIWPEETERVPALEVKKPGAVVVVDGALQPFGTVMVTVPFEIPPVATVYVRARVFPVLAPRTTVGEEASVPEPSRASTVTVGPPPATGAKEPEALDRSFVFHVCTAPFGGDVAPGPLCAFDPYTTVSLAPAARVTPFTIIWLPETAVVPVLAVKKPASVPTVEGTLHPLGTLIVTAAFDRAPAAV